MLLNSTFRHGALSVRRSLYRGLLNTLLLSATLYLSGCDVSFVTRIDLVRPNEPLQIKAYQDNKTAMLSALDRFALENKMACKNSPGLSRDCDHQQTESLVAFEDKDRFSICLFMIGIGLESHQFYYLTKTLEKALTDSVPGTALSVSLADEIAYCNVPRNYPKAAHEPQAIAPTPGIYLERHDNE